MHVTKQLCCPISTCWLVRKKASHTHSHANTCLIHKPCRTKQKLSRLKFQSSIKLCLILKLILFLRHYSISLIKTVQLFGELPLPLLPPPHSIHPPTPAPGHINMASGIGRAGNLVLFCSLELHMVLPKKPLLFKQLAAEM